MNLLKSLLIINHYCYFIYIIMAIFKSYFIFFYDQNDIHIFSVICLWGDISQLLWIFQEMYFMENLNFQ